MYQPINVKLALKFGIKEALCAQCLWDGLNRLYLADTCEVCSNEWICMSGKQLSLLIPYLTPNMTKRALKRLVDLGVVRVEKLQKRSFDHTYWYTFTSFGERLMFSTMSEED